LRSALIAARLADRPGLEGATAVQTYFACLLSHVGCTAEAPIAAGVVGGSMTTHFNPVMYGPVHNNMT
jgi:hypothetical protein